MIDTNDSQSVWLNYTESAADPAKPPVRTLREVVPLRLAFGRPDGAGTGQAGGEWWATRNPRPAEPGE
jgi:hypothetical protein